MSHIICVIPVNKRFLIRSSLKSRRKYRKNRYSRTAYNLYALYDIRLQQNLNSERTDDFRTSEVASFKNPDSVRLKP